MSRRVSSRLATKEAITRASDKENSPHRPTSLTTTPALLEKKAAAGKKTTPANRKLSAKSAPQPVSDPLSPVSNDEPVSTSNKSAKKESTKDNVGGDKAKLEATRSTKRKRNSSAPKVEEEDDELPHNMGKPASAAGEMKQEGAKDIKASSKKARTPESMEKEEQAQDAKEVMKAAKGPPKKKARKANPYGLTPGETPFPDWPHPTDEECRIVHDLLMETIPPERRKRFTPPDNIPPPSELVAGCGEVPSILDALIRTLLSAATNGQNSSNAFQGLVQRFGLATVGVGRGSVNWNAVHEAPFEDVFEAIKCGGLAKNKSQNIKKILAMVHKENQERLAALLKAKEAGETENLDKEEKAERELELRALQQGVLTLDYYHHLEKNEALSTFTNYPGIGVKTAACVNLFCMQRPCFAVDTHVFRLCQYLGWVPPDDTRGEAQKKVDRNTTFSHCEVRVPDDLKYGLHALFIEHGKRCPRCRAVTGEKSEGWADANCVIEHLVKRLGAKKGGLESPKKAGKGKKSKKKQDSDDEANGSEISGVGSEEEPSLGPRKASNRTRGLGSPNQVATNDTKKRPSAKAKAARATRQKAPPGRATRGKKSGKMTDESEDEVSEGMSDLTDTAELSAEEDEA